jgi:hypothetical protein
MAIGFVVIVEKIGVLVAAREEKGIGPRRPEKTVLFLRCGLKVHSANINNKRIFAVFDQRIAHACVAPWRTRI